MKNKKNSMDNPYYKCSGCNTIYGLEHLVREVIDDVPVWDGRYYVLYSKCDRCHEDRGHYYDCY